MEGQLQLRTFVATIWTRTFLTTLDRIFD